MHLYDVDAFGKTLKKLRESIGLTQSDVYESTGISEDTLRRVENGHTVPKLETLFYLSLMYKTNLLHLLSTSTIFNIYTQSDLMAAINGMIIRNDYDDIKKQRATIQEILTYLNSQPTDHLLITRLTLLMNFIEIIDAYKTSSQNKLDVEDMKTRILSHLTASDKKFKYPLVDQLNLNPIEVRLMLLYSELLRIDHQEHEALLLLEQLSKITQKKQYYDPIFKELDLKVSFNIAYCYHKLDLHDLVIQKCDHAHLQCVQHNLLHLLHLFLFRKAIALHYLKKFEDSMNTFNECRTLLKLTQQDELSRSYIQIYNGL